ncbi:MAG: hypothetical protein AVDCRST_MAG24-225, partial [uncultured Nocardioidaceae bacterium]
WTRSDRTADPRTSSRWARAARPGGVVSGLRSSSSS